jgi:hypothetical protein
MVRRVIPRKLRNYFRFFSLVILLCIVALVPMGVALPSWRSVLLFPHGSAR